MLSKEIIFIDYRELNVYLRILSPPLNRYCQKSLRGGGAKIARAPRLLPSRDLEFVRSFLNTHYQVP